MFCLMCNMQELYLSNNKIGDAGLQAFADALGKGALPKCATIVVFRNPASGAAQQAVKNAIASRQ